MNQSKRDPSEWTNYDKSSLPILLKYDTWTVRVGLSVLSGIDPTQSELLSPTKHFGLSYDEVDLFAAETGFDISDTPYWKIQLLADRPRSAMRTWYRDIDEYQSAIAEWDRTRADFPPPSEIDKPLNEMDKRHHEASRYLNNLSKIFFSNSDHRKTFAAAPAYYIEWAKAKGLEIPWLDWAADKHLLDTQKQANNEIPESLDKRLSDTLHTLIGALLFKLDISPEARGTNKQIEGITEDYGAPIRKTAISNILKNIPLAKESVQDRNRR